MTREEAIARVMALRPGCTIQTVERTKATAHYGAGWIVIADAWAWQWAPRA